ncbi:MAG: carbon-nitrogen hydrolase family protein [Chitinophagaceae bacterium]|nr:carbon-nitrogen hydrolase family protein [Chitinophagaceae bacterium]
MKRKKRLPRVLLIISIWIIGYFLWAETDVIREGATAQKEKFHIPEEPELIEWGSLSRKILIGIQPYLNAEDYATESRFKNTLSTYFQFLKKKGKWHDSSVVVFPEYIGTWLVALHEKKGLYKAKTISKAMIPLVLRHIPAFIRNYFRSTGKDKFTEAVLRTKAKKMASSYQSVFSSLASENRCTIVAGSIVLPDPYIDKNGNLKVNLAGPIYNTSVIFRPDGTIQTPLVKKSFPINEELKFTACGKPDTAAVFETKNGKMGVLICADSWYPESYSILKNRVDFVVVPSLSGPDSIWLGKWNGYNGFPPPADVDSGHIGKISEGEAWLKYSMSKRAPENNIHYGLNVFFSGKLWNMKPEGRTIGIIKDSVFVSDPAFSKGRITCLYLTDLK